MERLTGVVLGEGTVASFAQMKAGDEAAQERSTRPGRFRIALEDGAEVEVRCPKRPRLGPLRERRGRWGDLENDPLAEPFADRAPGGHVKVELEGTVVRAGDRVVVEGVVERRPAEGGYRGGDDWVVEWIEAQRVGVGEEAEAWLDEEAARRDRERRGRKERAAKKKKTAPRRASGPGPLPIGSSVIAIVAGAGLAAFGLVAWLGEHGLHVSRYFAFAIGLQLLIGSVYKLSLRRPLPRMGPVRERREGTGLAWTPTAGRYALGLGLGVVGFLALGVIMEAASYAVAGAVAVGLTGLALAALLFWRRRDDARALRVLLGAKRAEGPGWGLRTGALVKGKLQRSRTHTSRSATGTESYTDSDGRVQQRQVTRSWVEFREQGAGSAELELEVDGGRLRVRPEGGVWGTTELGVDLEARRMQQGVSQGDEVVVLGRLDDEGVIEATGPESLFVFGAPSDALGAARRALWGHRLAIAALALLGGLGVAVGWRNIAQDHRDFAPVVVSSTLPGLSPGDRCELHLGFRPRGRAHRCQGKMTCGEHTVYGGWTIYGTGFFDCDMNELTGGDFIPDDGDGAIHLRPGGVGSAEIPLGEVRFRLE